MSDQKKRIAESVIAVVLAVTMIVGIVMNITTGIKIKEVNAENDTYAAELDQVIDDLNYEESTGCLNYDAYKFKVNRATHTMEEGEQVVHINVGYGSLVGGLKEINDTYGHLNGAQSIKDFVALLNEVFPEDEFVICHRGGSSFLVCGTGHYTEETLLGYYNTLKERWHDTPYKVADGSGEVEGMALLYLAAVAPEAGSNFSELRKQLVDRKLALREITNCGYVLVMDNDSVISSEPSIQ